MTFICLWSPSWPDAAAFPAELAGAFLAHAPRVQVAARGRVWVDARGLDGSTVALACLDTARAFGHPDIHAGAATTAIAAELAATRGESPLLVVRPGTDRAFIGRFPVEVLEPSTLAANILDGIGVGTCAELAALDAESVEVRMGVEGVALWKLARADDPRLLFTSTTRPLPSAAIEWVEYALRDPERLLSVLESLFGKVCRDLAAMGERARELGIVFALADRSRFTHPLRASRPTAAPAAWMRQARLALDRIKLPDAVMGVEVRVERITGNDGAQGDLFDRGFASAPQVEEAISQLVDDQGDVVLVPSNSAHPLVDARTDWVSQPPGALVEPGGEAARLARIGQSVDPRLALQLCTPPREIRVTTKPRRDHRVPVKYRDGQWWTLTEAAGPDRVSGGQWDTPYAREYFRCVREDGTLVWLYREREKKAWYLQGWWD